MIGQLELIHQRFPAGILMPAVVWQEVVADGQGRSGAQQVAVAAWIEVINVSDSAWVSLLKANLDAGEAEALVLAKEQRAESSCWMRKTHARWLGSWACPCWAP